MDPLSQSLFGALSAQTASKKRDIKVATICGITGGITPDIDILIRSNSDPLLSIEFHRHFTHSIFFAPIGSFFVGLILWLLFFRRDSFFKVYFFSFLGFLSHGILDSFTSFGTHLLWPLSETRYAWNIISIVDPIFTVSLLLLVTLYIVIKSIKINLLAVFFTIFYLSFGTYQKYKAEEFILNYYENEILNIERVLIKPTIGNLFLWRTIIQTDKVFYVNAVNVMPFSDYKIYKGDSYPLLDLKNYKDSLGENSRMFKDILRFLKFTDNYAIEDNQSKIIIDLRYGTLPNDSRSLWGIKVDKEKVHNHANFIRMRNFKESDYDKFLEMLF